MDTLYVIREVPVPGKAITRDSSFTALKSAKKGLLSVPMHSMGLTFMSKERGFRRETCVLTSMDLATIWLKVRIDEFAAVFS
jgi:hypothetical protein